MKEKREAERLANARKRALKDQKLKETLLNNER